MVKVSFGMICKDSFPFIKYSIGCIFQYAYEIIVVDGGSTDGTVEYVKRLSSIYNKVRLVQGTYTDKNTQCNEYMKLATGDWVWNHDSDEIYHEPEIIGALSFLETAKGNAYCVQILNFWRDLNTVVRGGLWSCPVNRVFKHEPGNLYNSHRPLTIKKRNGDIIVPDKICLPGITMYHCSHIGIDRVKKKAEYYAENLKAHPVYSRYMEWYNNVYLNKDITRNLHITGEGDSFPFTGKYPAILKKAIEKGELNEDVFEYRLRGGNKIPRDR